MSKEIGKSPDMLLKEASIKELSLQIKKERSKLKGLKTKLSRSQEDITRIQRDLSNSLSRKMEEMMALHDEILDLLKACKKLKGLSKDEINSLDMLIGEMNDVTNEVNQGGYQSNENGREEEEQERAKMRDMFQQFQVKPSDKEQRDIRKVFIKLSSNFHPDKAKNEKQQQDFHSLMQQINESYQSGDIDKLLEIEGMYLTGIAADFTNKAVTIDLLTLEVERLQRGLDFIKSQVSRTSAEIKSLRKSDLGNMLTEVNRAAKDGVNLDTAMIFMDQDIENLIELKDVIENCLKAKSLQPLDILNEIRQNDFEDMFDSMFEEDDYKPVNNPKIPLGTSVQVISDSCHPSIFDFDIKGIMGRVVNVVNKRDTEHYFVQMDSISLKSLKNEWLEILVDEVYDEFNILELSFKDLAVVSPRDTVGDAIGARRILLHEYRWMDLPKRKMKEMGNILLKFPDQSDQENMMHYLKENLEFPFIAQHKNKHGGKIINTEVAGLFQWDVDEGLMVIARHEDNMLAQPLTEFMAKGKMKKILSMYHLWYGHTY